MGKIWDMNILCVTSFKLEVIIWKSINMSECQSANIWAKPETCNNISQSTYVFYLNEYF